MPEYEHRIWYFGEHKSDAERRRIVNEADIVICQGVKSLRIAEWKEVKYIEGSDMQGMLDNRFSNIVARLDSMRIDVNGEYFDIWDKK
jgi:hypothetical protein